jgi:hypothetical protein
MTSKTRKGINIPPPEGKELKEVVLYDDEYGYLKWIIAICSDGTGWKRRPGNGADWKPISHT